MPHWVRTSICSESRAAAAASASRRASASVCSGTEISSCASRASSAARRRSSSSLSVRTSLLSETIRPSTAASASLTSRPLSAVSSLASACCAFSAASAAVSAACSARRSSASDAYSASARSARSVASPRRRGALRLPPRELGARLDLADAVGVHRAPHLEVRERRAAVVVVLVREEAGLELVGQLGEDRPVVLGRQELRQPPQRLDAAPREAAARADARAELDRRRLGERELARVERRLHGLAVERRRAPPQRRAVVRAVPPPRPLLAVLGERLDEPAPRRLADRRQLELLLQRAHPPRAARVRQRRQLLAR